MFSLHAGYLEVRKIACGIVDNLFCIIWAKEDWDRVTGKMEASDKVNQGYPSVESQSSERTPLFSNVLLREESRSSWIQFHAWSTVYV